MPQIDILYLDKVIHSAFHFVFTMLWFLYLKKKFKSANTYRLLLFTLMASFVLGVSIELIQQYFTTTRSADVLDILANLLGAFLAALLIILLNRYNRLIDKI